MPLRALPHMAAARLSEGRGHNLFRRFLNMLKPHPPSCATGPSAIPNGHRDDLAQISQSDIPVDKFGESTAASTSTCVGEVLNAETVAGNVFMGENYGYVVQTKEEFHVLLNLPTHPDVSAHLSDYFPDSRASDVARILRWIDSTKPPELMLCILGKAGLGKSTLVRHLAMRLRRDFRLAAELFLGFALPDWTPESVIRMIARQLCAAFPKLTGAVAQAIQVDIGPSVSLETKIRKLILEPIRSLRLGHPLVVLMDALDQWAPHSIFIKALNCLAAETHLIRFVTSGRPGLEETFQNAPFGRYNLPDMSKNVMADYFRDQFARVKWEYGLKTSSQTIDQLVDMADGLFIWSSTLCSLLQDQLSCPKPHETLIAILRSHQTIGDNDTLAKLYHDAINLRFPKPLHKEKLRMYLGAVLALQEPLPVVSFAALVPMKVSVVQKIQAGLGAFQTREARDTHAMVYPASSTFHLSLVDYLQSRDVPPHFAFPIDTSQSHSQLGKACLEELHPIPSSGASPPSTSALQKYAVKHWPTHVARGTPAVSPVSDAEWKATPHCAILESLSTMQWQQWALTFLQPLCAATVLDTGAKAQTSNTSNKETTRSIISGVVKSVLDTPATAGASDFAIAVAEVAVRCQHRSSEAWLDLGRVYRNTAETNDSCRLLERAVDGCRNAVDLGGEGGYKGHRLLARCLWMRYLRRGIQNDLDEAISLERAVIIITPPGHSDRASSLNNLAGSLRSYHELTGEVKSLDEAIILLQEASSLRSQDHPDRAVSLNNLAGCLRSHHKLTGKVESLDEAIVLLQEALLLRPQGHPDRAVSLNNLAGCLRSHHKLTGKVESLSDAIQLHLEALSLWVQGHPDRAVSLNNLARCLRSHHKLAGTVESLDEAIALQQEALSLTPQVHPDYASSLNNLAASLYSQSKLTDRVECLDEAIVLFQEAVSLCPPGHHHRALFLMNLAKCLQAYCNLTGNVHHLDGSLSSLPPLVL